MIGDVKLAARDGGEQGDFGPFGDDILIEGKFAIDRDQNTAQGWLEFGELFGQVEFEVSDGDPGFEFDFCTAGSSEVFEGSEKEEVNFVHGNLYNVERRTQNVE